MKYLLIICILFLASCESKNEKEIQALNAELETLIHETKEAKEKLSEYIERRREHDIKYGEINY